MGEKKLRIAFARQPTLAAYVIRGIGYERGALGVLAAPFATPSRRWNGVTYLRRGPAPGSKIQQRREHALHCRSGDTDSSNTTLRTRYAVLPTRVLGCLRKNQYNF